MTTVYNSINSEITLTISYEGIRKLLFETLKEVSQGNIESSHSNIAKLAVDKCLAPDPYPDSDNGLEIQYINKQYKLPAYYQQMIRDIFWDLVIEGVVRPGISEFQPDFPGYHITEKGKAVIGSTPQLG